MCKFSVRFFIVVVTFIIGVCAFYYQESQKVQVLSTEARWESIYFKTINNAATLGGLNELRKTNLSSGDIEIRVWRDSSSLEAVVLKRTDDIWAAFHIKTDPYQEPQRATVRRLNSPKSGWESFWKQLNDKQILTLAQTTENDCDIAEIDGGNYIVEINENNIYRTFKYPIRNKEKCREERLTNEIGEIIGREFHSNRTVCKLSEWLSCQIYD